jgi:hypothetical protein
MNRHPGNIGLGPELKSTDMKPHPFFISLFFLIVALHNSAQENTITVNGKTGQEAKAITGKKINFFIVSKRKKGKLDLATRFNVLRSKIKSFMRPGNFVAIVANNTERVSAKVEHRLKMHHASIGTIWFDSHGMYKKGYSLFLVGHDEINYKTIRDSAIRQSFLRLTDYTDNSTNVVIGSCYGGATYFRTSVDYRDTTRMNGDSLMIALGEIFCKAKIYASESWVMTKPGLFNNHKQAVAGFPRRKLFRDVCYRPAWENVGVWNEYNASIQVFQKVNPVTLDSYGNLELTQESFSSKKSKQKEINEKIKELQPWLYK